MKVRDILNSVDSLLKNDFSIKQKVDWYNNAESLISHLKKDLIEAETELCDGEDTILLPFGVDFDMVEYVFIDGKRIPKMNFSMLGIFGIDNNIVIPKTKTRKLTIVARKPFVPVNYEKKIDNQATTNLDKITFSSPHSFRVGETVKVKIEEADMGEHIILSAEENSITLSDITMPNASQSVEIESALENLSLLKSPFDDLYINFIMAKIHYFCRDYEGYNNAMSIFNTLYTDYEKHLVERRPKDCFKVKNNII